MTRFLGGTGFANVTAALALTVALGGTAYAVALPNHSVGSKQLKKNAVSSKTVKDDSLTGSDINESTLGKVPSAENADRLAGKSLQGVQQWALLDSAGAVVAQSGGIMATKLTSTGLGRYRVSFPTNISSCGLAASAGSSAPALDTNVFFPATVMLAKSATGPNDVQVGIADSGGAPINNPFWITVQC